MDNQNLPMIDLWYGRRQSFGVKGQPQRWVNILGRIIWPTGALGSLSLTYTLNGGPRRAATIGPDLRRLPTPGDFNLDIDTADLLPGENIVELSVLTRDGVQVNETVEVIYAPGSHWPLPDTIDWSTARSIQDVAQVVDGLWRIENGALWPVDSAYDRLIAIGDVSWTDYEVRVPVTIYGYYARGYLFPSNGPAFGIVMRWQGHSIQPGDHYSSDQPHWGYAPLGMIGHYGYNHGRLQYAFFDCDGPYAFHPEIPAPVFGVPYVMKMRVESQPGRLGLYSFKIWKEADAEPAGWMIQAEPRQQELPSGSLLLLAHNTSLSFGNVQVTPLI